MFVFTAKVSKTKIAAVITILIAIVVLIAVIIASTKSPANGEDAVNADTNDERVTFLAQYGWDVNAEPVQSQQVSIPSATDNEVFNRYNALQISQGYDLSQYSGKNVMRYVYEILNYPDATEPVYATLFVYKGQIIGGDVTNSAPDGKIHGFEMPS